MKKTLSSLALAAVAVFAAQAAFAQSPTREEVKKETAAANKAGQIPGTGTSNVPAAAAGQQAPRDAAAGSTASRPDVKKETAAANKAGDIPGTGVGGVPAAGYRPAVAEGAISQLDRCARRRQEGNRCGQQGRRDSGHRRRRHACRC